MVLAAGFGSRLRPLTLSVPKALVPVLNIPILSYNLLLLKHFGVDELIINLHFLPKNIEQEIGKEYHGIKINYSYEQEILGTGGGIKKVQEFFEDDTFFIINCDILIDVNLQDALTFHKQKNAVSTLVLKEDSKADNFGAIEIDSDNRIRKFVGKGEWNESEKLRKCIFTGVHIIEPSALEYIPPDIFSCICAYTYPKLLKNNEKLYGFPIDSYWSDLGTVERYYNSNMELLSKKESLSYMDPLEQFEFTPKKEIDDVIRIGKNVTFGNDIKLNPPVVIGDKVKIGKNTKLGPYTIIGDNCNIGNDVTVTNSIIWKGTKISEKQVINKTIINRKTSLTVE